MKNKEKKFSVFIARKIPEQAITLLEKAGLDVSVNTDEKRVLSKHELMRKIKGKDALLSLLTDRVDRDVIATSSLKIIANYAVGVDNIDIHAATEKGILVTNTPGVLTETVAEHTLALMVAAARRIVEADSFTRKGKYRLWGPFLFLGHGLRGKTLGIIGLGSIGSAVAKKASNGFEMKIIYHQRSPDRKFEKSFGAKFSSLDNLLRNSDFISIHVPLTPKTRHLIGKREFRLMKKTAIIVNTARGPIIEEKSLVDALKNKKIFAAALDVFECEPELTCSPGSLIQLKDLSNIILTPHIASGTFETRTQMAIMAAQSIIDYSRGKIPKNLVNQDVVIEKMHRKGKE